MTRYTPMETAIVRQLAAALLARGLPVKSLRIFGSRARGHSSEGSDLDIAVELESAPDPRLSREVMDAGRRVSIPAGAHHLGLRVQSVPFFQGEETGYLTRAIAQDAETVWTRT